MSINYSINDGVAVLCIESAAKLNALSSPIMYEVSQKIEEIALLQAKVLVLTGGPKAFSAGVDLSEIELHSAESACLGNFIDAEWESVFNLKIPTVAAVSGYALGAGFELALMCDIIIAAESAKFGFPEVNLGLMPGMGGTQLLTRIVGPKSAAEIIMTGDLFSARRAAELKIVSLVTPDDRLMPETLELAKKIAEKPSLSLRMIKEALRLSQNIGLTPGIQSERLMFRSLFSSEEKKKRVRKFLGKN
jgi:enoyl-CoA hydratase/carnithine racemase